MTRFIVRVDDVGQSLADPWKLDVGLTDFAAWWDAWGGGDAPIYLATVPHQLTSVERDWLLRLESNSGAEIALHGWDHHPHTLQPHEVKRGLEVFPGVRCHVAPFNRYDLGTIRAIRQHSLKGIRPVLMGGLLDNRQHQRAADHPYGERPRIIEDVVHLAAHWEFYPKNNDDMISLLDRVQWWPDPGYPIVLTLHWSWNMSDLGLVRALRAALGDMIVPVDEAIDWTDVNA